MPFTISATGPDSIPVLQSIVRKQFRDDFRLELYTTLRNVSRGMRDDLNRTVETWENHKVKFTISSVKVSGQRGTGAALIGDSISSFVFGKGDTGLWESLDVGTTVMGRGSKDWSPKTSPKVFLSFRGSGYWMSNVNQVNQTDPRLWTETLLEEYSARLDAELVRAIDRFGRRFPKAIYR